MALTTLNRYEHWHQEKSNLKPLKSVMDIKLKIRPGPSPGPLLPTSRSTLFGVDFQSRSSLENELNITGGFHLTLQSQTLLYTTPHAPNI